METPESIHAFWFGAQADDAEVAAVQGPLWWKKNPGNDELIRQRFGDTLASAARNELDGWADTAAGRLALIIIADQFSRHVHRDTPAAFALDRAAQHWSKDGIAASMDQQLRPIERVFFYLPLEHSEALPDQEASVSLYLRLAENVPPGHRSLFEGFLRYALRHRDIIARFGRFPHRNHILGRQSTKEEAEFLEQPGASF